MGIMEKILQYYKDRFILVLDGIHSKVQFRDKYIDIETITMRPAPRMTQKE